MSLTMSRLGLIKYLALSCVNHTIISLMKPFDISCNRNMELT